jgi:DNA-binding SARP family transcriptional activator/tetratricopeptide (TPR) repeat protein/predicted ATPase
MTASLQLVLLGTPQIFLDGHLLTAAMPAKAQALLFYLAVTGRPHSRAALAALLWGDTTDEAARASLRKALQPLRQHLAPILRIERDNVNVAPDAGIWVDSVAFQASVREAEDSNDDRLRQAVDLYRGDFLEGFYVRGAPDFEAWWLAERALLRELAIHSLAQLAGHAAEGQNLDQAIALTRRLLALEPWREQEHRRLMTWLAQSGQRAAALAQFETCRQMLVEELAVEPSAETVALYERIRTGAIEPSATPKSYPQEIKARPPAFLEDGAETAATYSREPFVGREPQMGRLAGFLEAAQAGRGQVAFVSGEAGWGKTRLLEAFSDRAQATHPDLIVATGTCTASTGVGDPYLPFREVLRILAAGIEQKWSSGSISHPHALRLWQFFPRVVETLVAHGRHLIGAFVSEETLLRWAAAHDAIDQGLLQHIQESVRQARSQSTIVDQERIFVEISDVFQALARNRPLLLVLDDLHWADPSSVSLLFHLGRRLQESPVLILGAYRPEEITLPRDGREHSLAAPLAEFRRMFGDVWVELDRVQAGEDETFVGALLDAMPNRLGQDFRQALARHTGGHPLFTVETLRDMKERGDLARDEMGRWVARPALDWNTLPARVEGVIETRIRRLDAELRELLDVASVEGETFTAQVVARVRGADARSLVPRLDRDGDQRHRLVQELGVKRVGGQRLSVYRFRHNLFQRYLVSVLSESKRAFLHEDVGNALEGLYGEEAGQIAVALAGHFQAAGIPERAVPYLLQASQRAMRLAAYDEAISLLSLALASLHALPSTVERSRQELGLRIALGEAQRNAGHVAAALETFQQAAASARELGAWNDLALAALGYEEARWRYNLPAAPAAALLQEALAALGDKEGVLRVRLLGGLVRARLASGIVSDQEAIAQEAVAAARRLDDPLALYDALRIYLFANWRPSASNARLGTVSEMVKLAEAMGNPERLASALGSRTHEHMERGDIRAMDADLEAHERLTEELGQPFYLHTSAMFYATRRILGGEFLEAEQQAQRALQFGLQTGTENAAGVYGIQMFSIRREQGRLVSLAPLVQHFVQQNPASATWRPGLALIYSELGMAQEARTVLEELAAGDFASIPRDAFLASTLAYLSEVCAALHDAPRAALLYPMLLPYDGLAIVAGFGIACYGAASRFLGLLAMTLSRWDDAERHFVDALEMNSRMGARPWLAHTQHQYAAMLLARGCPDDRSQARALLDAARRTASELGMEALHEKAIVLTQTIPA